jgi:hypothetical protein
LIGAQSQQGPAIGSLTVSPGSVAAGSVVTFGVHGVAASSGTVSTVYVYRDANNNGQYDAGDPMVGSTTGIRGGEASIAVNTSGLAAGSYRYLTRALDSNSRWSAAASVTLTVLAADDHGNAPAAATAVGIPSSTQGVINASGDRDWFKFQATAGSTYTAATQLGTLRDSVLYLYDRNGAAVLSSNDDYGSSLASQITWKAAASGTYYLVVAGYGNSYTGSYTLSVRAQNSAAAIAAAKQLMPLSQLEMGSGVALAWMAMESRDLSSAASHNTADTFGAALPATDAQASAHDDVFSRLAAIETSIADVSGPLTPLQSEVAHSAADQALPAARDEGTAEALSACCPLERHVVDEIFGLLGP